MKHGKYELGRTLGEGNFGKVKFARRIDTGEAFAIKILDLKRILDLKIHEQIKREIATLKLLKHPNVVRLHEATKGRLSEKGGRKLFQQLIDGISYCHDKGVYHRDLKPENVLIDASGNIKISDFGLSALSQHLGDDGLLHTTCGSPNYIAPEVLANRGYDGAISDIWSCGVVLYVILTGTLPFDDRNLAVLYQKIFKGDARMPKFLSPGAQNTLRRILDPNPRTRLNVGQIKEDAWFKLDYSPIAPHDDDESLVLIESNMAEERNSNTPSPINAFGLIGMSSCLDLSGFFEKEDVSERKVRFTSNHTPINLFERIEEITMAMGFEVQRANRKLKVMQQTRVSAAASRSTGSLSVAAEAFELSPSLCVVELRKSYGDSSLYRQLCSKISEELGLYKRDRFLKAPEIHHCDGDTSVIGA